MQEKRIKIEKRGEGELVFVKKEQNCVSRQEILCQDDDNLCLLHVNSQLSSPDIFSEDETWQSMLKGSSSYIHKSFISRERRDESGDRKTFKPRIHIQN